MRWLRRTIGCALPILFILITNADAALSKQDAQKRVEGAEQDDAAVLAKIPTLAPLIDVVKADCAAKVPERAKSATFCTCAAAITMEIWRSGADPKMVPRLVEFAAHPDPAHAPDFLTYQGPEFYKPLCELAEPDQ